MQNMQTFTVATIAASLTAGMAFAQTAVQTPPPNPASVRSEPQGYPQDQMQTALRPETGDAHMASDGRVIEPDASMARPQPLNTRAAPRMAMGAPAYSAPRMQQPRTAIVTSETVTNGPVPDTAANRAKYPPLSRAGRMTPICSHCDVG